MTNMTTSTRYLGTCGCCEREIKVRDGKLVHHGYQRPGHGWIEGDCYGALRPPHELSPEVAQGYRALIVRMRADDQKALDTADQLTKLMGRGPWNAQTRDYDPVELTPADGYDWEQALTAHKAKLSWRITSADREVTRMDRLLTGWEKKPLRTVEEEKAQKRAAKAERDAARARKRADKVAAAVERYQARIDSAVRRENFNALGNLWEDAPRKLRELSNYTLTREASIRVLDREAVWERLGLLVGSCYAPKDHAVSHEVRALKAWPTEALTWAMKKDG